MITIVESAPVAGTGYQVVAREFTHKTCNVHLMRPDGSLAGRSLIRCDTYKARHYVTTYARYAERYLAGESLSFIFAGLKTALDKEIPHG